MPVEAFIRTADRTPFNYLIRPLSDYIARTFRDG
jgi:HlyD family secretion protein